MVRGLEEPEEDVGVGVVCAGLVGTRPARKDLERRLAVLFTTFVDDGVVVRRSRRDADICLESLHEYPGRGDRAVRLSESCL